MAVFGNYCKAYPVGSFAAYQGWREKPLGDAKDVPLSNAFWQADDPDARILFLQENFVVTDGVYKDENIVFDEISSAWIEFCQKELQFDPAKDGAATPILPQ